MKILHQYIVALCLGVVIIVALLMHKTNTTHKQKKKVKEPIQAPPPPLARIVNDFSRILDKSTTLDPVVSVITTVYTLNEQVIQTTVSCIKNQSLQNWEWLIVDDAVEENARLKSFTQNLNDTRIRYVRKGHNGLPGARNVGISEARGIYFYPLDDDDLIEHHTLEILYFSLQANPAASFVNGYSYGFGYKTYKYPFGYGNPEGFMKENFGTYSMMCRRDHWLEEGGYATNRTGGLEDWDMIMKLMNANKWGYTIPEYLFSYRTRATHADRWPELSVAGLKHFIQNLPDRYPNLAAKRFPKLPCPTYTLYEPIETHTTQPNGVVLSPLIKKKQRLLLIVPWLVIGGADKFNRDFVKGLVNAGWDVTIACTRNTVNTWRDVFAQYTSDIFILSNFLPYAQYPRFLRHLLVSRTPDVVMTSNSGLGYNLIPFLTASCPQAVFVDYSHAEHMSFFHGGFARMAQGLSPWYDINFVASSHLRDWMLARGVPEEKAKVLHVGVAVHDYIRNMTSRAKLRKSLEISNRTTVVTLAARLDAMKQPLILCHVASRILKSSRHRSVHFVVAGDGDQRIALEKCISANNMNKQFSLLGYQSIDEMKEVLSASDILFLSSQMEGIPCIFYEAMAAHMAVIGPDVGGISELVVNNVTGYVVPVKNGTEFQYSLISVEEQIRRYSSALLNILDSPGAGRRMGKAGLRRIKTEFSIEKVVTSFIRTVNAKKMQKLKLFGSSVCEPLDSNPMLNEKASMALAQGPLHMGTTSTYCELFGCNDVGCVELQKKMMKKMMKKKMKKTHK